MHCVEITYFMDGGEPPEGDRAYYDASTDELVISGIGDEIVRKAYKDLEKASNVSFWWNTSEFTHSAYHIPYNHKLTKETQIEISGPISRDWYTGEARVSKEQ